MRCETISSGRESLPREVLLLLHRGYPIRVFVSKRPEKSESRFTLHELQAMTYDIRYTLFSSTPYAIRCTLPAVRCTFTQNKPNLLNAQMNVSHVLTKDYERNDIFTVPENKANSNPIPQRNTQYAIRDTRYKPNQSQSQIERNY